MKNTVTDFHTHLLPGMDDGSQSPEESLEMLREIARQGIARVVATPHFYAECDRPDEFERRRQAAAEQLRPLLEPTMPQILLGAEVRYYEGIGRSEEAPRLCVEHTRTLLLEMPEKPWNTRIFQTLNDFSQRGIRVVIAHAERCLPFQPHGAAKALNEAGYLLQSNAEFFLNRSTRRRAVRLFADGLIGLLGSDCHHLRERRPCLGEALAVLDQELGAETVRALLSRGEALLYQTT